MEKTHWKKLRNNDYLGSWAFQPGEVKVATIKDARREQVIGSDGKKQEKPVVYFSEPNIKPLVLNTTNGKAIAKLCDSPYTEDWRNIRIAMRVVREKVFGVMEDCVRVANYVPPEAGVAKNAEPGVAKCTQCGGEIKATGKLTAAQVEAYTRNKYGRALCGDCATKISEQSEKEDLTNEPIPSGNAAERTENTSDSDT